MMQNLSDNQMSELRDIFKTEAYQHIKTIARILLPMTEKGHEADNVIEQLGQIYVAAHGIKGAAATVGLDRVATLAEVLDKAVKILTQGKDAMSSADVYVLLEALDAIRKAVEDTSPTAKVLTAAEIGFCKRVAAHFEREPGAMAMPIASRREEPPHRHADMPPTKRAPSISVEPPPPRRSGGGSTTPRGEGSDIPDDQLNYLLSVFQAEASEHIKSLAELLFALEEGTGDVTQTLVKAFREAHSLKGSSGTIGFERVATVTHALEDVLGALKADVTQINPGVVDILLDTLDVIRRAIKEGEIGDGALNAKEAHTVASLKSLVSSFQVGEQSDRPATGAPQPGQPLPSMRPSQKNDLPPPNDTRRTTSSVPPAELPPGIPDAKGGQAFVRVSEEAINNLIAQIGELFEGHLYLTSATTSLGVVEETADDIINMVSGLTAEALLSGKKSEEDLVALVKQIKNLRNQIGGLTSRFKRDERQFAKLILSSQDGLRQIRLAPISRVFVMIRRQVREICRLTGKRVELFLDGGEYAVDRKVLEAIEDPLIHLLRNAVDHGIEDAETRLRAGKGEKGHISVIARHVGDAVELSIKDDGRGIDPENIRKTLRQKGLMEASEIEKLSRDQLLDYLFESGFSTQRDVSKISGRGVGLDVVKYSMERLGGEVRLDSLSGSGSTFSMRLPLSMSTLRCLLVRVANRAMAIPTANVEKVLLKHAEDMKVIGGGDVITYMGQNIPFGSLTDLLELKSASFHTQSASRIVVIVAFGERRVAFQVDDIIEYAQLILRPLGDLLERVSYISGLSLLGTGEIALVLNPSDLVRASGSSYIKRARALPNARKDRAYAARILVVDDSMTTRILEKNLLESAGYAVVTASDGYEALEALTSQKLDLVITDIQMPKMDGLTLTQTIKTQYRFLQLPVILVSSLGSDEDKQRGMASGADAYIVKKALSQSDLIETIEQLL